MDLDAVLARHPEIALVDEFAHTNVPGSRINLRVREYEVHVASTGAEALEEAGRYRPNGICSRCCCAASWSRIRPGRSG